MRFHFSFHKCLTKYSSLVFHRALNNTSLSLKGYKHFNSLKDDFITSIPELQMASLNNHFFTQAELESLSSGGNSYSLFIRDPRDLLVSGYYYHRKGIEPWTRIQNPSSADYDIVNGCVPECLKKSGLSMHQYLERCDIAEGLLVELEFRTRHFQTLSAWLTSNNSDLLVLDYNDIIGNEVHAFTTLANHHKFNYLQRKAISIFAEKYSAKNSSGNRHIRNPQPGQWRSTLTDECLDAIDRSFPGLLQAYDDIQKN